MAPMPLLVALGYLLGDLVPGEAFQCRRDHRGWRWAGQADALGLLLDDRSPVPSSEVAVLELCVSAEVTPVRELAGLPSRRVGVAQPVPDLVDSRAHVVAFMRAARRAMVSVAAAREVHVLMAIPNSLAVEFGRLQLPKSHPPCTCGNATMPADQTALC